MDYINTMAHGVYTRRNSHGEIRKGLGALLAVSTQLVKQTLSHKFELPGVRRFTLLCIHLCESQTQGDMQWVCQILPSSLAGLYIVLGGQIRLDALVS